jgi:hypothetical protein
VRPMVRATDGASGKVAIPPGLPPAVHQLRVSACFATVYGVPMRAVGRS